MSHPMKTIQESAQSRRDGGMTKSKMGSVRATVPASLRGTTQTSGSNPKKGTLPARSSSDKVSSTRFPVKVFDEEGVDVTPLPLLTLDSTQARIQSLVDTSVSTPTDILSQLSTGTTSLFGGGAFSRSVFTPSFDTAESVADEESTGVASAWAEIRQERAKVQEKLTEEDLDKEIIIDLTETNTFWFLNVPTVCVAADDPDAENISLDNFAYAKLCKSRAGNDLYAERGMNSFNEAPKVKAVQTSPIGCVDAGVVCTNFDLYDAYIALETEGKEKDKEEEEEASPKTSEKDMRPRQQQSPAPQGSVAQKQPKKTSKQESQCGSSKLKQTSKGSNGIFSSPAESDQLPGSGTGAATITSEVSSLDESRILNSESLRNDLFTMERVINLNTYQPKLAVYRGFSVISDVDSEKPATTQITMEDMGPNLDRLWSYACPLTKGHNVACMAWSKANPDLLAVGYGQFEFTAQKSGLICCWCLKNPEYPERIFTTKFGVTALDFSEDHPNILAAGYYDGVVALYNVHSTVDAPLLDSHDSHNKHMGPVWQIQWIEKERGAGEETAEVLISVSTDGHVMQWSVRNGFECYDIMRLKKVMTRMNVKQEGHDKEEAIIARYAGGLCFDFDERDHNVYLVGTEEGFVHKCSCSYNEQYLETYSGHMGPVYRVRWSPFLPTVFLSCSADWSLCLWHQERTEPILKFYSSTKQVPDLCWSPRCSTVFACVNEGSVEVWDLAQSTLDPVIVVCPTYAVKLSSIVFAKNTDCILVGDSEGQVTVYELRCMPPYLPMEVQATKLKSVINASLASQLSSLGTQKKYDEHKESDSKGDSLEREDSTGFVEHKHDMESLSLDYSDL